MRTVLVPLNHSLYKIILGKILINPVYQNQFYDPDNKYSIPYWITSKAILYNPAETDLKFENFSDLAPEKVVSGTKAKRHFIACIERQDL